MYQLGRISVYIGILLVIAGMLIGFGSMMLDTDGKAITWLGIIPVGFVALLLGTVMTQLSGQGKDIVRPDLD
ncbi:MAG: hypothetical protein OEY52_08535 [Gammaproteobacteria bacterium]|nr:hypothetical protein [Gammaproteobacteria bacterium]